MLEISTILMRISSQQVQYYSYMNKISQLNIIIIIIIHQKIIFTMTNCFITGVILHYTIAPEKY
jgi:hypothetical protein